MSRAPIKNLFMALILAFTGLTGADILAADIYKESGDYACRGNLLTPEEARRNQRQACNELGEWDIARLAGGGSMDGPGYGCRIRNNDNRRLGDSLCISGNNSRECRDINNRNRCENSRNNCVWDSYYGCEEDRRNTRECRDIRNADRCENSRNGCVWDSWYGECFDDRRGDNRNDCRRLGDRRTCEYNDHCSWDGYYGECTDRGRGGNDNDRSCTSTRYRVDESYTGNRCNDACDCDGARACSAWGWCQGTSR